MRSLLTAALSVDTTAELPTEFRIFRAGPNETQKGTVLFDEVAAKSVMAAAAQWAVDLMIDLEHQSLSASAVARADAPDARGWFRLALRDGELWAVDVRWTPDGAERLTSRRQRYISPAFEIDPETMRVIRVINAAICAMPATNGAVPLMAASLVGARARARVFLARQARLRR